MCYIEQFSVSLTRYVAFDAQNRPQFDSFLVYVSLQNICFKFTPEVMFVYVLIFL